MIPLYNFGWLSLSKEVFWDGSVNDLTFSDRQSGVNAVAWFAGANLGSTSEISIQYIYFI
jgi:hypothetical protein